MLPSQPLANDAVGGWPEGLLLPEREFSLHQALVGFRFKRVALRILATRERGWLLWVLIQVQI